MELIIIVVIDPKKRISICFSNTKFNEKRPIAIIDKKIISLILPFFDLSYNAERMKNPNIPLKNNTKFIKRI